MLSRLFSKRIKISMKYQIIQELPPINNFDDTTVLKALNLASRSLAELKGETKTIPNADILINTLSLQESKESSEIENIANQ